MIGAIASVVVARRERERDPFDDGNNGTIASRTTAASARLII